MLHGAKRCGRTGVWWSAAHDRLTTLHDRLTTLRDWIGMLTTLRDWIRTSTTRRDWIWIRGPLSLRFRGGGRDSRTVLHCTKRCGRTGVRWFAAHDRLTTLRD